MRVHCLAKALLWLCISIAGTAGSTNAESPRLTADFYRRAGSFENRLTDLRSPLVSEREIKALKGFGRNLHQASEFVCEWGLFSGTCSIGVSGFQRLLETVDNSVAEYLHRRFECLVAEDEATCREAGCVWLSALESCEIPHQVYRKFHSVECLQPVDHLLEIVAGNLECNPLSTELSCSNSDRCYWSYGHCRFDKWKYYHGLATDESLPETFYELLEARLLEVYARVEAGIRAGEVGTSRDVLSLTMPEFDCPSGFEQVVCDYVAGFTNALLAILYCGSQYPATLDMGNCDRDDLCESDPDDADTPCTSSLEVFIRGRYNADLEFADAIEDREARLYERRLVECGFLIDAKSCEDVGYCMWDAEDEYCRLDDKWIEMEIFRLVGEEDDPVCQYFSLGGHYGCLNITDEETCGDENRCYYFDTFCDASLYGKVYHALEVDGDEDLVAKTLTVCGEAESLQQCAGYRLGEDNEDEAEAPAVDSEIAEGSEEEQDVLKKVEIAFDDDLEAAEPSAPAAEEASTGIGSLTVRNFRFAGR